MARKTKDLVVSTRQNIVRWCEWFSNISVKVLDRPICLVQWGIMLDALTWKNFRTDWGGRWVTTRHREDQMHPEKIRFQELLGGHVQYVVPRWQRRYRWGKRNIMRLLGDLLFIAEAESGQNHYGGALITVEDDSYASGLVRTIRVVDGQQRLTTVSLLINAIAKRLGPGDTCIWTHEELMSLLFNLKRPEETHRKLRLQDGDEEHYRQCLGTGKMDGSSAVTEAYALIRDIVERNPIDQFLRGLERFQVVRIGLDRSDDPQQIFESLNATGLPLTESEKVKNWLLMPLSDGEQKEAHDTHWRAIEKNLNADHSPELIDLFLRDFLRWKTGDTHGKDRVYEEFRRWADMNGWRGARGGLVVRLARWSYHYGILTGKITPHPNRRVERELVHLRELGLDTHRPFTLRLLDEEDQEIINSSDVVRTLRLVSIWLTRTWLADRRLSGHNKTFAEWANRKRSEEEQNVESYWQERLYSLQNTRSGVPTDEEVGYGITTRTAYGSNVSKSAFAVLCYIMETDHREEAPARDKLTLEHILPDTLTPEWRNDLGEQAEELRDKWLHRLPNLTLSGAETNARLSNGTFEEKKSIYRKSPIGLTRELADEDHWSEDALKRRAERLTMMVLELWPWESREIEHLPAKHGASDLIQRFWQAVRKETGGLLGQKDTWRGRSQWSQAVSSEKDYLGYGVMPKQVHVYIRAGYIRAGHRESLENRTQAMLDFSRRIRNEITDQKLGVDEESEARKGRSITIVRDWDRDDEGQWPEVARWLKEQQDRLLAILEKHPASE